MTDLAAAWSRLFPADATVGADLLRRWAEPHRRYHTLDHLALTLGVIDEHADLAEDPDVVRLAAWYHDAVYDPTTQDNEERSARLALDTLPGLGLTAERTEEVARLVRMTAGHAAADGDANACLLADADLAILAGTPEQYASYAVAVRQEYAFVPDELFRVGRASVLRQLLDLPALYRVVPERAAWTSRARTNVEGELLRLRDAS